MPQPKGCKKPEGSGKPMGHPGGRPIGSLGKELKPKKVKDDAKDFEALLTGVTGSVALFDIPGVQPTPMQQEEWTPEDTLEEAKMRLAYMNDEDTVKRYLIREFEIDEKEAKATVTGLKKQLNKEFDDYIKSYSKDNIMAIRYMLKGALRRNDLRNATDILKALDYMTTKYVEGNVDDGKEIDIDIS